MLRMMVQLGREPKTLRAIVHKKVQKTRPPMHGRSEGTVEDRERELLYQFGFHVTTPEGRESEGAVHRHRSGGIPTFFIRVRRIGLGGKAAPDQGLYPH